MAAMVLLLTAVLAAVAVSTRGALLAALDREIVEALEQETAEFEQFLAVGVDPATGGPFRDAAQLLAVHLDRQRAGESEVLGGVGAGWSEIRGQQNAARALEEAGVLAGIATAPADSGSVATSHGDLEWMRVPVRVADAPNAAGTYFVVGFLVGPEREEVDRAINTLLVISAIGLMLAAMAAWLVAGRILGPVRLVRTTAAEITEEDLSRRIPVRGRDDIAALAEQFNAMLDRVEYAFATQREFLDDASHELRTPITIVSGTLELLSEDPAERAAELQLCRDELARMERIVNDLLLLAKAERPDFVRLEPVELVELTCDLDVRVRALGLRRWRLDHVGEGVVQLDAQRVTQAVLALADNAVQHTTAGDEIRLGSALVGRRVRIWVADSGPGVPDSDRNRLFQRFVRGPAAYNPARGGGAGLGLAIVAAIAQAHGGVVELDSRPGEGATFTLDLPAENDASAGPR